MKQYKYYVEMDEILKSENDLCKKLSYCFDNINQNNIIEKLMLENSKIYYHLK